MRHIHYVRGGVGDLTHANVNARPQDNLYLAVNSAWQKDAKIPADRTEIGINTILDMRIEHRMISHLNDLAAGKEKMPAIKDLDKAVKLYELAKDFNRRNIEGAEPIKADLKKLLALKDFNELNEQASELEKIYPLPFRLDVDADMKDTRYNVLQFAGPGTFLPDTTSYKDKKEAQKNLDILQAQTLNLLRMAGASEEEAKTAVQNGLAFDQKLSKVVKSTEEWSDYAAAYNPYSMTDFLQYFKSFAMEKFLQAVLPKMPDKVIVQEPRFLKHFEELINPANFAEIKGWMVTKFINKNAQYLSQDFRKKHFPFVHALWGQDKLMPQEREAYYITNSAFYDVLGIYYGQTYLSDEAKKDVEKMLRRMINVYEDRIAHNDWLSEETKKKAIIKLRALVLKIGYPDKVQPLFDSLPVDANKSLYENMKLINQAKEKYAFSQLTKPVDRTVWVMEANINNACYDPQRNDVTLPAGILQPPFYDLQQSTGANYGGIGATIAHEISHAFDNDGAKYDEKGNLHNWWTKKDFAEFNKRIKAMSDIFDGLPYGPVKLNGKQVVSENIADLGGLTCAIQSNKLDKGNMKDLFICYAKSWAQLQRPAAIKSEVAVDVHAPQPTRVNIPVQCQPEFYETFAVKPSDGMWLDPKDRIVIW